jgi:hypothetical protein
MYLFLINAEEKVSPRNGLYLGSRLQKPFIESTGLMRGAASRNLCFAGVETAETYSTVRIKIFGPFN